MPASAYVGVGPDQNFTYIAALKPRIAFIVDIRRQNMLLHLMYKALIELSPTREEFLSRLFSRAVAGAAGAGRHGGGAARPRSRRRSRTRVAFERNRAEIYAHLQQHARLQAEPDRPRRDRLRLSRVLQAGPDIRYSFGRGSGWQPFPTYKDLMTGERRAGACSAATSRARSSTRRCATWKSAT